jgi:hypothetical protein
MTQIAIRHVTHATEPNQDPVADAATIKLLHEVIALRSQLRALEPQLSAAITAYGMRRGYRSYREFYLRNELNEQAYKER